PTHLARRAHEGPIRRIAAPSSADSLPMHHADLLRRSPRTPLSLLFVTLTSTLAAQPQWQQRTTGDPAPRYRHAMAYDSGRGVTLLCGGGPNPVSDTWGGRGAAWRKRIPVPSPPGSTGRAMGYDSGRGVTTLSRGGPPQTWEWNGTAW